MLYHTNQPEQINLFSFLNNLINIKEHQEYDNDKLAMKLYDIAHENTLLIDSSALNPQQRAEEVHNWINSKLF